MTRHRWGALVALTLLIAGCAGPGTSATPEPSTATTASPIAAASPTPSAAPSPTPAPSGNPAAFVEGATYAPTIDPADFVDVIDNPYMPWIPGTTTVFEGISERIEVTVTHDTKVILGVTTTVVHDQVFEDGDLIEDTLDWYAQDRAGNVWYFGEDSKEIENGEVTSTAGSWEAGVDGAQPGIVMPAVPVIGETYRQEYYVGEAEDMANVIETGVAVEVPAGSFTGAIVTEDFSPLEPENVEQKTYAPGIGVVLERSVKGDKERNELVTRTTEGS